MFSKFKIVLLAALSVLFIHSAAAQEMTKDLSKLSDQEFFNAINELNFPTNKPVTADSLLQQFMKEYDQAVALGLQCDLTKDYSAKGPSGALGGSSCQPLCQFCYTDPSVLEDLKEKIAAKKAEIEAQKKKLEDLKKKFKGGFNFETALAMLHKIIELRFKLTDPCLTETERAKLKAELDKLDKEFMKKGYLAVLTPKPIYSQYYAAYKKLLELQKELSDLEAQLANAKPCDGSGDPTGDPGTPKPPVVTIGDVTSVFIRTF